MTVGERIAQKRKELGLSQEALGEKLCVSRQAIYKWESDAALPEIEKLVALSKLFEVPVGWLLGVEAEAEVPKDSGELNETQIKMVEEIVGRYLAAQPKPKKPRRGLQILAAAIVVAVGIHLFNRLDGLDNQYNSLRNAVNEINWSVNTQINGIAGRVEAILKAQNELTADYGTELVGIDLLANTATFGMQAVPKTFVEGMNAVFLVNSGAGPVEVAAELSTGGVFSAEVTTDLTDEISLSVVFLNPDGTRQNQLLDTYTGLFYDTVPDVNVTAHFYWTKVPGGVVSLGEGELRYADVRVSESKVAGAGRIWAEKIQVGVFVNQKLVAWGEECQQPDTYVGDWGDTRFFRLPEVEVTLGEGDQLCIAALVTDNYGRQSIAQELPYAVHYDEKGNGELRYADILKLDYDLSHWVLTAD